MARNVKDTGSALNPPRKGPSKAQKAKEMSEDDLKVMEAKVQKSTDAFSKQVDDVVAAKEKEITTV